MQKRHNCTVGGIYFFQGKSGNVHRIGRLLVKCNSFAQSPNLVQQTGLYSPSLLISCSVTPELEKARAAAQAATPAPVNKAALEYITERNSKRDWLPDIPLHRLWRPADTGEVTFVGLRSVAQQNLLIASNGTEYLVLPITAEQGHHLAQHQRGITLTISSAVTIQAHVQGLER
jgi:hypothetical protein